MVPLVRHKVLSPASLSKGKPLWITAAQINEGADEEGKTKQEVMNFAIKDSLGSWQDVHDLEIPTLATLGWLWKHGLVS